MWMKVLFFLVYGQMEKKQSKGMEELIMTIMKTLF